MAKDKLGATVEKDDLVWVPCVVEWVHDQDHGPNLNLRTLEIGPDGQPAHFGLNAKQVRKASP